jgi:hypothetical protein
LYDTLIPSDETSYQIIAETVPVISDSSFYSLRDYYYGDYDIDSTYTKYSLFIKQLRNCLVALPLNEEPYVLVEEDGCGLIIWF